MRGWNDHGLCVVFIFGVRFELEGTSPSRRRMAAFTVFKIFQSSSTEFHGWFQIAVPGGDVLSTENMRRPASSDRAKLIREEIRGLGVVTVVETEFDKENVQGFELVICQVV